MILIDLILMGLLVYAAYAGTRRGFALIGFELISFALATVTAFLVYRPVGQWIKTLAGLPAPVSNVAGFILVWMLTEILAALIFRFTALPHLHHSGQLSRLNQAAGAILNVAKAVLIITLGLVVFAGLPLAASTKQAVTNARIAQVLLASSTQLQTLLSVSLGRDLSDSLNFFTVPAEPESEQRIELGYTTTGTVDPADEQAMLDLLNHERTSRGLPTLRLNTRARAVARTYSIDMFGRGYFSHISLEGKSPFDRMRAGGLHFNAAGENLALAPTLALAHQGLMNSPGHRANILNPAYHTVGIGIINGGPYGLMITQDFTD